LEHIFPTISKVKIKKAVFVGIHIRDIVKDGSLDDTLSEVEEAAWTEFTAVTTNVYENFKAKNYEYLVQNTDNHEQQNVTKN